MKDYCSAAWGTTSSSAAQYFHKDQTNLQLAYRVHLLTLLIKWMEKSCVAVLKDSDFVNSMLDLIYHSLPGLQIAGMAATPRWMATVLLIIDQCEKSTVVEQRKAMASRVLVIHSFICLYQ